MIEAKGISYQINGIQLVLPLDISFHTGEVAIIMGPNGAGKSTLLKLLTGALNPASGMILFKGQNITSYPPEQLATERAVLSQSYRLNFPILVSDIIMMGRYPYFDTAPSLCDQAVVDSAVSTLGVSHLLNREYNTLSGGEAQKVQMARVLAQVWPQRDAAPKALFLDEPVSSLDVRYQHEILYIARKFAQANNPVVMVLHDINLALQYGDRIYFMKEGEMLYSYSSGGTIDLNMLHKIFDVRFEEVVSGISRRLWVVPD